MAKIMLVEDDNNLREIYEARLLAEGYEIVSAKDGEEALALAVKEKPDLIISDVMMPKISGFDMLDILRTTPETKNTKVIMMTALSQAEDKTRADKLGADRYLVKSQVTLEDVAKVAKEVLSGEAGETSPEATTASTDATPEATTQPPAPEDSSATMTEPSAATEDSSSAPAEPVTQPTANPVPEPSSIPVTSPDEPVAEPAQTADPQVPDATAPVTTPTDDATTSTVATPPADESTQPAADPALPTDSTPTEDVATTTAPTPLTETAVPANADSSVPAESTAAEESDVDAQITDFVNNLPVPDEPAVTEQPAEASVPAPEPNAELDETPADTSATDVLTPKEDAVTQIEVAQPPADATSVAADNAAKLADAVNDVMSQQAAPGESPVHQNSTDSNSEEEAPSGSKKVIEPLNDITTKPDIAALAEKEANTPQPSQPQPGQVTVGGAATTSTHQPGNVIGPSDPNSVAL